MDSNFYNGDYYHGKKGAYENYIFNKVWIDLSKEFMSLGDNCKTFFDAGCAKGFLLKGYILNGINKEQVNGIDISEYAIDNCEEEVKGRIKTQSVFDIDVNQKYDVVTALDFLEHIEFKELKQVVNILSQITNKYMVVRCMFEKVDWDKDPSHVSILPMKIWEYLFNIDGFRVIKKDFISRHVCQMVLEKDESYKTKQFKSIGLLTVRNEGDIIFEFMNHIEKYFDEVVVIDDSDDGTYEKLQDRSVIKHLVKFDDVYGKDKKRVDGQKQYLYRYIIDKYGDDNVWVTIFNADAFFMDDPNETIKYAITHSYDLVTWWVYDFKPSLEDKKEYEKDKKEWLKKPVQQKLKYLENAVRFEHLQFKVNKDYNYDINRHSWCLPTELFNYKEADIRPTLFHYPYRGPEQLLARAKDRALTGFRPFEFYSNMIKEGGFFSEFCGYDLINVDDIKIQCCGLGVENVKRFQMWAGGLTPDKRRKVLFLGDNPKLPTGYAKTTRISCNSFSNTGSVVYTAAFNTADCFNVDHMGQIVILPNRFHTSNGLNSNYGTLELLLEYDNTYNFDVIIIHNDLYRYAYIKDSLPLHIQKKLIFWVPFDQPEGVIDGWVENMIMPMINNSARCYFISKYGYDAHRKFLTEKNMKNMGYIRHAIETWDYRKLPDEETKLIKDKKQFTIIRVDRNQPRKNWLLCLQIFKMFICQGTDNIVLEDVQLIAKTNPHDSVGIDLEKVVSDLGISDKVKFTDIFYSNVDLNKLYNSSNIFFSTTCGEGFGLALAEASSAGLTVVAPNDTVIPEILNNGEFAELISIKERKSIDQWNQVFYSYVDDDECVEKLTKLYNDWKYNDSKLLNENAVKARKYIYDICNADNIYGQWNKVFQEVIKENNPKVIIGIVTYNSSEYIEDCVRSIWNNTKYSNYEIVIVDNNSQDGTQDILHNLFHEGNLKLNKKITVKCNDENVGFAKGCNQCVSEVNSEDLIMFLNPDTKILPSGSHDWLQLLKNKIDDDPKVGICGPASIIIYDKSVEHITFIGLWCALVRGKAYLEVGGLDDNIAPAYWEDIDFNVALFNKGYKKASVDEKTFLVWHKNCHAKPDDVVFKIMWSKNRDYFLNKWKDYIKDTRTIDLSVIIGYYNQSKSLDLVLDGYVNQTCKNFNIVIADDGSDKKETKRIIDKYKDKLNIEHVWHKDKGFRKCKILNVAIKKVNTNFFILTDADVIPAPNLVEQHHNVYKTYGDRIITVGLRKHVSESIYDDIMYDNAYPDPENYVVAEDYRKNLQEENLKNVEFWPDPWHLCYGCNISISRRLWEENNGFDEDFKSYGFGEDIYFAYKSALNGCHFGYIDDAYVYHIDHPKNSEEGSLQLWIDKTKEVAAKVRIPFVWRQLLMMNVYDILWYLHGDEIGKVSVTNVIQMLHDGYGKNALKNKWNDIKPGTKEEIEKFYREAEEYIYDLSHYNSTREMTDFYNRILSLCKDKKLLDFGGGIGTFDIIMSKAGAKVFYYDLKGKISDYAEARFKKHNVNVKVYLDDLNTIEDKFDVIFTCDVLEHLVEPIEYMKKLSELLNDDGIFIVKAPFEYLHEDYPMHIKDNVKYAGSFESDMNELGFIKVEENIYKRNKFKDIEIVKIDKDSKVTIEISTKDRQQYLATLLTSLLMQTFQNWELLVLDNSSDESLKDNEQINKLFAQIAIQGHRWRCNKVKPMGPQVSHQIALELAETPLVCRIDDDIVLQPDFLEKLVNVMIDDPTVGACGGIFPFIDNPSNMLPDNYMDDIKCQGKITCLDWSNQIFKHPDNNIQDVEHLHSSFLYRTDVCRKACVNLNLSKVGFREETIFSHCVKLAGYSLKVVPDAIGYHFACSQGGTRMDTKEREKLAIQDDQIFHVWLNNVFKS